jgi:hypothetical protein
MILTEQELSRMRELLKYPDPTNIPPDESRWRAFARHLNKELKEAQRPPFAGVSYEEMVAWKAGDES